MKLKQDLSRKIKVFRKNLALKLNRFRLNNINITFQGLFPKITINERHEKMIKTISRIILFTSIVLSFISLPFPISVIVSLSLILLEQFIERFVYSFVSAKVLMPFPNFDLWNKAEFAAVITGVDRLLREPSTIGMFFKNENAGREVFNFISIWNNNLNEDFGEDSRVKVSFVIHPQKNKYAFFVFPNLKKGELKRLMEIQKEKLYEGKKPHVLIGAMIMCKLFNYKGSGFELFRKYHKNGHPYRFTAFSGSSNPPKELVGVKPIMKNHISILTIDQLNNQHIEKFMCDYNIDWDDNSPIPESLFYFGK